MEASLHTVTFKGKTLSLSGRKILIGDIAPNALVTSSEMDAVYLHNLKKSVKILTSFISLDTPVCDRQVKNFNELIATKYPNVQIVGVSHDLPFAQKRFCDSFSIENISLYSDYKTSSFGFNYGLLIKEWGLLARAVMIVDSNQTVRYFQIVPEITESPDLDAVLKNLDFVLQNPLLPSHIEKQHRSCVPCKGKVLPLPKEKREKCMHRLQGWDLIDEKKLTRDFPCANFMEAHNLLSCITAIAEEEGHHPTMTISYRHLTITLTTHAADGLTENDFIMAHIINNLY